MNRKDKLTRPFEKSMNRSQKKLYDEFKTLCKQSYVIDMTYPELFQVIDALKLRYQIDLLYRRGAIKWVKKL